MKKGGGSEKSPDQQVAHVRALLRNILRWMVGDPRFLEFLSEAIAKVDPLFVVAERGAEALAILDDTVTRLHALQATLGHAYLALLAACQGKRAEILCCLGQDAEASSASEAADEILSETYFATVAR